MVRFGVARAAHLPVALAELGYAASKIAPHRALRTLSPLTLLAPEDHALVMLLLLAATASIAALAPLSPLSPLAVNVTTPDGHHRILPIDNTSGRLVAVCADDTTGGAPVCAPVVAGRRGAHAAFDHDAPVDSNGALRLLIASPDLGSDGATAVAIGCGLLGGAAVGGAVVAGAVAGAEGADADTVDTANTAAAGLWLLGGASAIGTGVAVYFAVLDNAPQTE